MGCVWFIYRNMELRYWLVPGNVKNNRVNQLSNASAVNPLDVWSPGFKDASEK